MISSGSKLRVAVAPAVGHPLLDVVALRDRDLVDDLAAAARASRLVPQSAGIQAEVGRDSIALALTGGRGFEQLVLRVGFDGSVVGEGPVDGDEYAFGGMVVMADRAREAMDRTLAFAEAVWQRIDTRDEVLDVFVACAVPEAQHKVYALQAPGNSLSQGWGLPHLLVVPEAPLRVRRADLADAVTPLEAELHRAFELQRAVYPRDDDRRGAGW